MGKPAATDRPSLRSLSHSFTLDITVTPSPQNRADQSPGTRLKQSTYPKRRTAAVNLAMAGVMHEPQIRESVCAPAVLGDPMVDVESLPILQVLMTDGAETLLSLNEVPATKCRYLWLRPSLSPVVLERRVIGGMCQGHQTMADDLRPSKFPQGPVPRFILEDPAVVAAEGPSPIFLRSPPPGFPRVATFHVALSTCIHEAIEIVKDLFGHRSPKVLAPAPDHRSPGAVWRGGHDAW